MTANPGLDLIGHVISNHVNIDAKSARWSVNCSCGWSRNRFNSCATANGVGVEHQIAVASQGHNQSPVGAISELEFVETSFAISS